MSLPSLSQMHQWSVSHLEAADAQWRATARIWDESFSTVYRQAPAPAGTPWDGLAAEAAIEQLGDDRRRVLGATDALNTAAGIARDGAAEIQSARQQALQAIELARAAGFAVGEDLSVTDATATPVSALSARMAQARSFAASIQGRAAALVATEREVAARITAATSGLNSIMFSDNPILSGGALPTGPVVWCLLQGTAGSSWRCSVLYPGGGVAWYWSTTDDSGAYGP